MSTLTLDLILDPAVRHDDVERAVRDDWDAHQRSGVRLSLALRRLYRDNVHRRDGRGRFSDWARERFGIPEKLAWTFSLLGRDLEQFPLTRAAMEEGRLGYTKVREFIREVTPENEAWWLEFAAGHTNREIEREIARRNGRAPERSVSVSLTPEEQQDLRRARERMARSGGAPASEQETMKRLVRMAASGEAEPGLFAAGATAVAGEDGAPSPVAGRGPRPWLSMGLCVNCLDTWVPVPGENVEIPITRWLEELAAGAEVVDLVSHFLCDCEGERHRRDRCEHAAPPSGPPPTSRHVPEAVRRVVEARDGFRCRTPGCTHTHPLDLSHLKDFAAGTPMLPEYLAQHCRACNDMIRTGRLVVEGAAPFERYFDEAGKALGIGYDPRARTNGMSHAGNGNAGRNGAALGPPDSGPELREGG